MIAVSVGHIVRLRAASAPIIHRSQCHPDKHRNLIYSIRSVPMPYCTVHIGHRLDIEHYDMSIYPSLTPRRSTHTCMGAMLNILLHFFVLSSCPTTPLMRLPIGSPALLMSTQALSSNRTALPSRLPTLYLVRTTTACLISPRLTFMPADAMPAAWALLCSCTTTTIRSPKGIAERRWLALLFRRRRD